MSLPPPPDFARELQWPAQPNLVILSTCRKGTNMLLTSWHLIVCAMQGSWTSQEPLSLSSPSAALQLHRKTTTDWTAPSDAPSSHQINTTHILVVAPASAGSNYLQWICLSAQPKHCVIVINYSSFTWQKFGGIEAAGWPLFTQLPSGNFIWFMLFFSSHFPHLSLLPSPGHNIEQNFEVWFMFLLLYFTSQSIFM